MASLKMKKNQSVIKFKEFPPIFAKRTGKFHLISMNPKRVKEILSEISYCGLCIVKHGLVTIDKKFDENWIKFEKAIIVDIKNKKNRWDNLDEFLSQNHDMYKKFSMLKEYYDGIYLYDILNEKFSIPTTEALLEWGLRLNKIQQNYLSKKNYYFINKNFINKEKSYSIFKKTLFKNYQKIKENSKLIAQNLSHLAELTCEELLISRNDFKKLLTKTYKKHRGKIILETGLILSHTHKMFEIKNPSILNVIIRQRPWYELTFYYQKIGLPKYAVSGVPRRFITINQELIRSEIQH